MEKTKGLRITGVPLSYVLCLFLYLNLAACILLGKVLLIFLHLGLLDLYRLDLGTLERFLDAGLRQLI